MRIEDFPRPPEDNGRGVHWSARLYHDVINPNLDAWIERLQAMQIKWVKLLDDGGGSGLALSRRLLAAGIMPVVRLYMAQLNPHTLGSRELDTVSRYVDAGIRYFESNNEPDLPAEWQNGQKPANWLDVVMNNFIRDADGVLARGGLPALPAMGPGSLVNPVALVVNKGRRDLFERGGWIAVHNYTLNHPLNYPFDAVNQSGEPISSEEFNRLAAWQYSDLTYAQIVARHLPVTQEEYNRFNRWAWDGRSPEQVNATRAANKNPGHTLRHDANCFLGYRLAGEMAFEALGFHVPVISTEGGPVVGWGDDNRYAKMNPTTQAEYQLEIVRHMQSEAPPWYLACCTWLLAARPLGDFNPTWEQMAWVTSAWDVQFGLHGVLPVVQALIDEPSTPRPDLQTGQGVVTGVVTHNDQPVGGLALHLQGVGEQYTATTDAAGTFRFDRLRAGVYRLHQADRLLQDGIELVDNAASLHLAVALADNGAASSLCCRVYGADSRPQPEVTLALRLGENELARAQSGADGVCTFGGLSRGAYHIMAAPSGAGIAGIALDGWRSGEIALTLPAAAGRYALITRRLLDEVETANRRAFFGRVLDEQGDGLNGITLEMRWRGAAADTQFPRVTTPRDPLKSAGNFEFSHSPGLFSVQVIQGDYPGDSADDLETAQVPGRDGDAISYELVFQRRSGSATGNAVLSGVIAGAAGLGLTLWQGSAAQTGQPGHCSWARLLPADGTYAFRDLPAGAYTLMLEGRGPLTTLELAAGTAATFNDPEIPVQPPGKPLASYWLLPPAAAGAELLSLLLPYLQDHSLLAGSRLEEAMQAAVVTLVGDETNWSAEQEAALRAAGCAVQRLPGDPFALAEVLQL